MTLIPLIDPTAPLGIFVDMMALTLRGMEKQTNIRT